MSSIEFDESKFKLKSRRILGEPEVPGMIKFLVVRGIVKSERQAIGALLTCVVTLILLSIFIGTSNTSRPATIDAQYISMGAL